MHAYILNLTLKKIKIKDNFLIFNLILNISFYTPFNSKFDALQNISNY
jgi:hypothetical protein